MLDGETYSARVLVTISLLTKFIFVENQKGVVEIVIIF